MKSHYKLFALLLCIVLVTLSFAGCGDSGSGSQAEQPGSTTESSGSAAPAPQDAPLTVGLGSGPSGGNNYLFCTGFSDLVVKANPHYTINVEISTGSQENIRSISSGMYQMGMVTSDAAWYAYNAMREYEDMPAESINYVVGGFQNYLNLFVHVNSDIQSVEDLRGKKVGAQTGMVAQYNLPMLLSGYGLTEDDVTIVQLDSADLATAFQDNTVDAAFYCVAAPQATLTEIATTKGFRLLPLTEEAMDNIIADNPFFAKSFIPGGVYADNDADVPALSYMTVLVGDPNLEEEFVYNFVKTLMEDNEALFNIHTLAAEYNLDNTLNGASIPIHPGAARYYIEAGIL